MAKRREDMQRLYEQRDKIINQIAALKNQLEGLNMAIQIMEGDQSLQATATRRPRGRTNVKGPVLEWLEAAGVQGMSANEILDKSTEVGKDFDRGTVSSLLSRLKSDGTLSYNNDTGRYIVAEFLGKDLF